jgi:hypothetical protein
MQPETTKEALARKLAQAKATERYDYLFNLVGSSGHGKSYSPRIIAWRERVRNEMREMARNGDGIIAIEIYVLRKIDEEENGSIR